MPSVKAVALDDHNEFASSRGGWLGDWSRLTFFHWVNPMETETSWVQWKIDAIKALYDVALHPHVLAAMAAESLPRMIQSAAPDSILSTVKMVMESMIIPVAPLRQACW
mmetsp:Transcript_41672/g.97715  ORF Transcript_41672/g.97715 Transcript_41672/m.97715 type:complete len:109 (+) Transcript_41672:1-327(+)